MLTPFKSDHQPQHRDEWETIEAQKQYAVKLKLISDSALKAGPPEAGQYFLIVNSDQYCDRCTTVENRTRVTWFLLLGLTEQAGLKGILSVLFLFIYSVTLMGNVAVVTLTHADPQLHTPVYFSLSVLSFIDSFSTFNTPRLLESFLTSSQSISFAGCMVQMALTTLHGTAECLLLAIMASDRFAAICHPLLYHTVMSQCLCVQLVAATYTASVANSALLTGNIFKLPCCGPNIINHYFCDIHPVLQFACADTAEVEAVVFSSSALIVLFTITVILVSYAYILVMVCRMCSLEAQSKALSTCASHLAIICLFYGTISFMYAQPSSHSPIEQNKVMSVFYTVIIPMLNPLIYSLRNKDVKAALKRRCLGMLPS
ncbi:olfactory receptor 476-like [Hippopotamus amphibius kiboko]|uniref:olfactory receptor 476-like n=1 Tax=Hippopotamus amphibius kiboko TaxID=575201 RepID=UPI002597CD74|nr:olfactory receptor 476-like [Hippopotamus amphibius kiboko]